MELNIFSTLNNMFLCKQNTDTQSLCNTLENVFSINNLSKLLIDADYNLDLLQKNLGIIIEYYIKSRDNKTNYSFEEILDKLRELDYNLAYNQDNKNIIENIKNNFFTHSCNGYFLESIKKNGLGSRDNVDIELKEAVETLEKYLGGSRFLDNQIKDNTSEIYVTMPGAHSIYYTLNHSPERLYLGILRQDETNALPIKIGESKLDYSQRVLKDKISFFSEDIQKLLLSKARIVLDKMCTTDPICIFIPIKLVNNAPIVNEGIKNGGVPSTVCDYLDNEISGGVYDSNNFCHDLAGYGGNLGDLAIINTILDYKDLGIIKIPDMFQIMQLRAKLLGADTNDTIDYFSGEILSYDNCLIKKNIK